MRRNTMKFGEVLRRVVPLSRQDIEEVIQLQQNEQRGLRFGEIALSLGLCQPHHVWRAWGEQLACRDQLVDLEDIGIDAQAVCCIPLAVALELGVLAIRATEHHVIVAVSEANRHRAAKALQGLLKRDVRLVRATPEQIDLAIETYYAIETPTDRAA